MRKYNERKQYGHMPNCQLFFPHSIALTGLYFKTDEHQQKLSHDKLYLTHFHK